MFDSTHGSQLRSHVTLLGWLVLGSGLLGLAFTCSGTLMLVGIGLASGEQEAALILPIIAMVIALVPGILSVISTCAGYGLLTRRSWARPLALLDAAFGLIWFPVGTLLGVYAFWVLLHKDAEAFFAAGPGTEVPSAPLGTPGWDAPAPTVPTGWPEPASIPQPGWEGSVPGEVSSTEPRQTE